MKTGNDVQLAADLLRKDELVAIPTETVYGLAANAFHEDAVLKIFKAKNRPFFDPLILHIASVEQLETLVENIPEYAGKLMAFWPGPLTLLFRKKKIVPDIATSGLDTVAIRIPDHPLTLELLRQLVFPLAAPSANPFGYVSPTTAKHVADQLGDKTAYILDGGPCRVGVESTIMSCIDEEPRVLRLGGLTVEKISEILGFTPQLSLNKHSNPQAPGQLDKHYAPEVKIVVTADVEKTFNEVSNQGIRPSLLSFSNYFNSLEFQYREVLSPSMNLDEACRNLFSALRRLDSLQPELVIAEKFPDQNLGRAINDRLSRASA